MKKLTKLFSAGKRLKYTKGDIILKNPTSVENVYLITSGKVSAFNRRNKENKRILIILKENEIFPIDWGLNNIRKDLHFQALSKVELLSISKQTLIKAVNSDIGISREFIKMLTQYLSMYIDRLENLELPSAREKVISRLLFFRNRFGKGVGQVSEIDLPLTHQLIADSVNLTRETVTRELKKLEDEKLISMNKKLVLKNISILYTLIDIVLPTLSKVIVE